VDLVLYFIVVNDIFSFIFGEFYIPMHLNQTKAKVKNYISENSLLMDQNGRNLKIPSLKK
jgi:heat shock protein HspQ